MASTGQKRCLEDAELRIKLAVVDEGVAADPLMVDRTILAAFSSCIRGLPSEAEEWDISEILIEGQPVQRQTVVSWLNSAYSFALDEPFDQDAQPERSMPGLAQLLAFADAIGSTKGLLRACLSDLVAVYAPVTVEHTEMVHMGELSPGSDEQANLSINGVYRWEGDRTDLVEVGTGSMLSVGSEEEERVVVQQVATQVEQLLFIAHKLQLPALQQKLHDFLVANIFDASYLLYGYLGSVLTDRVLEAAVDKQQLRQLAVNSMITQTCGFLGQMHAEQVLEPLDLTARQQLPLKFKATLLRDAFGYAQGQSVSVELQLFGQLPYSRIGSQYYVAQLLVGSLVWDAESLQAVMGPGPVTAAEEGP
jgi:hypothetical protein